jgi:hypothetical protein
MTNGTITVGRRFCGPPDAANGGYVAGLLARELRRACVRVRLLQPVPIERELRVDMRHAASGAPYELELIDATTSERAVAAAVAATLDLAPPLPLTYESALQASRGFTGHRAHPFPGCFVCGTARARGDGLRLFAGPLNDMRVAASWLPDESLVDADGRVRSEFIWAALDCPGYFAAERSGAVMLLGEMTARLERPVQVDDSCAVLGWRISVSGRRHEVGTALFCDDGELCAIAHATWIQPREPLTIVSN